jgi:hypothetical protein
MPSLAEEKDFVTYLKQEKEKQLKIAWRGYT